MISYFCKTSCFFQVSLLIISQFTVIFAASVSIFAFMRRVQCWKRISLIILLVINMTMYILAQLDSPITSFKPGFGLHIPYAILLFVTVLSLGFSIWVIFNETRNRRIINHSSIKEAFDNLPTGICFFNGAGLPVLCNLAMYRFSFAVCGRDVQFISDLENCFAEDFRPAEGIEKDGLTFVLKDGSAWHLDKRTFAYAGEKYIQYIALDVTSLYENRMKLMQENEQLRKVQKDLQKLSANVVAITREEEILSAKMRVHDEMGRCLVAAQRYLKAEGNESIPDNLAISWQRAVSMIKYTNDTPDEDMLAQIRKSCEFMNIMFIKTGELPQNNRVSYILTCAVRECVTNAVRYAEAARLYADFTENEFQASVVVYNDGKPPEHEIAEGGGLSTLRCRVERAGGIMRVQSFPRFKLTVTIPKGKGNIV